MMRSKRSGKAWLVMLLIVVGAVSAFAFAGLGGKLLGEEVAPTVGREVQRGPLRISVIEKGNLKAADSVLLKSEVEGRTTILYLIEEGTWVEAGTLVCELDTAELTERRVSQEITVQNNEASFVKAKQSYEIQVSQNTSEVARAERELDFAKLDLKKYLQGDFPQEQQKREEEILLADEELTRAQQDLEWSEKLATAGFLENTQLEADRLAMKRAEITTNQKTRALELLKEFEHPRKFQELEADVIEKERELLRVRLQTDARLVDYDADRRTSKARLDLEQEKLAKLDSQIEKARMIAPVSGMVVYYQEDGSHFRGGSEPMQEGREVHEREGIITIPSAGGMVAEASLHESVLEKVIAGQGCLITVDAVPDRVFRGRVQYKAVLPDQNSWWANPDLRVYRTEIALLELDPRLRPGMSSSIEIVIEDLADAMYVPLQSIFLDEGRTVCFVSEDVGVEKRDVDVGQNNGKWVVIESGLEAGETVLLSQPQGFGLKPAIEERSASPAEPVEEGMHGGGGGPGGEGRPATAASERGEGDTNGDAGERFGRGAEREGGGEPPAAAQGTEGTRSGQGERPARGERGGGERPTSNGSGGERPSSGGEGSSENAGTAGGGNAKSD